MLAPLANRCSGYQRNPHHLSVIDMTETPKRGPTSATVTNADAVPRNFGIEGDGLDGKQFARSLQPGETKTLQVELKPGSYEVRRLCWQRNPSAVDSRHSRRWTAGRSGDLE